MSLFRSIATVGSFTLLSRILGFARDILIAAFLGAGGVADAFFVAFKFPNLFRRLFAEGAFNAAFVPLFSATLEAEGPEKAKAFAREALSVLAVILALMVALMEIIMPWAMHVFAPGFVDVPGQFDLAVQLTRITFPYLFFISLVSLFSGVLNSVGKFAAAAATPVLLNIVLISALLGLSPYLETSGHALAYGVAIAGVVQFVWLVINCRQHGMDIGMVRPRLSPDVKVLLKRIVPGAIGAGVYQINLLVDTILASLVGTGAVSYLYYADRVNQLPLGVVGVAVGTALLPMLSRQLKAEDNDGAMASQNRALEVSLLLTIPAALALLTIAEPIVSVLFQRGAFGQPEVLSTSMALMAFSTGLPAYVLIKVLAPGFFARGDTKTPVKVALMALTTNIVLNLILMGPLGHVGIALATAISSWLNAVTLAVILHRKGHLSFDTRLKTRLPRIILSAVIMAVSVFAGAVWISPYMTGQPTSIQAAGLGGIILGGMAVFAICAQVTGAASLKDIKATLRRQSS